jgi:phage baseplate assembly protein W
MTLMSEDLSETIERFERLAARHRINAERAGALWVWEARLRTAENLEPQAAKIRAQLLDTAKAG